MKSFIAQSLIIFILCLPLSLKAQIKPVMHYTEDDGLAGKVVHDLTKDQNGILWIATESGISKFDGKEFQNIYKTDGLPSNLVWTIEADDKNNIYAGCFKAGLAVIRNDKVVKVLHTTTRSPDTFNRMLFSKHYNRLFVGTDYGLFMLNDTSLIPVIFEKQIRRKSSVLSISETGSRIFFATLGSNKCGLYELFPDTINPEESYAELISGKGRNATAILNDTLYSALYNRIFTNPINKINSQQVLKIDSTFAVWTMAPVSESKFLLGGYWGGRYKGNILFYDVKKKETSSPPYSVNLQTVNDIYIDSVNNTTWLASEKGLTSIYNTPFDYCELKSVDDIIDIGFAGDSLMVLTQENLYYLHDNIFVPVLTKQQIYQKLFAERKRVFAIYGDKLIPIVDFSKTFDFTGLYSKDKRLFVCSAKGALSVPDMKTYLPMGGSFFLIDDQTAFAENKRMSFYLRYSFKEALVTFYPKYERRYLTDVIKIIESKGVYYFATNCSGLFSIKGENILSINEKNSGIENNISDIEKDKEGNVWCSSASGSLYQVELTDSLRVLRVLNSSNAGIIGDNCKWLFFSDDYLFVSTDKGLNAISIESLYSDNPQMTRFFNSNNGFDFISSRSPVIDENGYIYVHTNNKVIKIKSDFTPTVPLNLDIRNVLINNKKSTVDVLGKKMLPFSTKNISFDFFAVKYPTARNLDYSYRVNNGEWIYNNKINLQSLRSGRYEILMEVLDKETNSKYSKVLRIVIRNPFWETWWFISLFIVALALLFYTVMRIRINRLNRFHEEKSALITRNSELKLRSLQLQMSPHFIFNSLTSVQKFIITQSTEEALTYLGNLASIIRTNLENATDEYIHLSSEIDFLKKYVDIEKMRFKDKLEVYFVPDQVVDNIMIPPMLIQPVIENSIKHGIRNLKGKGEINVTFEYDNDIMIVTVEDNGVGREFTKNLKIPGHKSMGMNVIKQRLELLNEKTLSSVHRFEVKDLYNDGEPAGTRVKLFLSVVRAE